MLASFEAKRSRWVYEGSELELESKNPIGCYSVFRHSSVRFIGIIIGHYAL